MMDWLLRLHHLLPLVLLYRRENSINWLDCVRAINEGDDMLMYKNVGLSLSIYKAVVCSIQVCIGDELPHALNIVQIHL